jgi:polyisoprenoid-binding protein YceI
MKHVLAAALFAVTGAVHAADTYPIDPGHTFAQFEWDHFGFAHHTGKFNTTTGSIILDLAKKTGSVEVEIDVNSINTGVPKLDEHLKSADFLDVAKYPSIKFKSTAFHFDGDALTSVDGDLSIHGTTKPVTLKITHFACKDHPMKKMPACGADATATIKRSEFGVGAYVPAVGDELNLKIEVEAQKK